MRRLRQLEGYAEVPIIAMTANAYGEDRIACLAAGMDDHLAKPVDPPQLHAMLLRWLAEETLALCAISSVTGDEAAITDHLMQRVAVLNPLAQQLRVGNALVVRCGRLGATRIGLFGHSDTVPQNTAQPHTIDWDAGKIYGLGASAPKPIIGKLATALGLASPAQTLVFKFPGACHGPNAIINGTKMTGTASYWDAAGKEKSCDLSLAGDDVDVGQLADRGSGGGDVGGGGLGLLERGVQVRDADDIAAAGGVGAGGVGGFDDDCHVPAAYAARWPQQRAGPVVARRRK